jgi:hypothetical protein
MRRVGLVAVLFFAGVVLCYSEENEFFREFRYRIVQETPKNAAKMKTPPMFRPKSYSIVLEYRKVNSNKGLGGGGWKKMNVFKASAQPTYRDVEHLFSKLPAAWTEDGYTASLMPTDDNRNYWWDADGSFHYYVRYIK